MNNTNFVYFSSGSVILHNRTILSVLSLLNNYILKDEERILIYTDKAEYYQKFLINLPIEYHLLDEEKVKKMMGADDLIHRVKIGVIEDATKKYPEHNILYADSDTFFYKEFAEALSQVSPKTSIMHKFEYEMSFLGTYPVKDNDHFRAVYDTLSSKEFIIKGDNVTIKPESFASWNAGLIVLHPSNFNWFSEVYELTDQLYAPTKNHACEQYAFSYFLQKRSQLISFENYNYHYWHRIEKKIVDEFLSKKLDQNFANLPLSEKKNLVKNWCEFLLKKIPKHEYMLRYKTMIAFQEKRYSSAYQEVLKTLLTNPLQDFSFFKDVAYYTKKMLFSK